MKELIFDSDNSEGEIVTSESIQRNISPLYTRNTSQSPL